MRTIRAFRFVLGLNPGQERDVLAYGVACAGRNWVLIRVEAVMDQRAAGRAYGVADERLTLSLSWSLAALCKAWNQAKAEVVPWWGEVSKEVFDTGLGSLVRSLRIWSDFRSGEAGRAASGFLRFRSCRRTTSSVRVSTV